MFGPASRARREHRHRTGRSGPQAQPRERRRPPAYWRSAKESMATVRQRESGQGSPREAEGEACAAEVRQRDSRGAEAADSGGEAAGHEEEHATEVRRSYSAAGEDREAAAKAPWPGTRSRQSARAHQRSEGRPRVAVTKDGKEAVRAVKKVIAPKERAAKAAPAPVSVAPAVSPLPEALPGRWRNFVAEGLGSIQLLTASVLHLLPAADRTRSPAQRSGRYA